MVSAGAAPAHGAERCDIALVDVAPLGVDTPDDLRRARDHLALWGDK
jgi:hypothetical protein